MNGAVWRSTGKLLQVFVYTTAKVEKRFSGLIFDYGAGPAAAPTPAGAFRARLSDEPPASRKCSVYVIITDARDSAERQVYQTVCYGPFESPLDAREFGREFLNADAPARVVELRKPENIPPAAVREALESKL